MIDYTQTKNTYELQQILRLQKKSLPQAIPVAEQKTDGFVTLEHDLETLLKFHEVCPHIIAKVNDRVVGYALSMHPMFEDSVLLLRPMFEQIKRYFETNHIASHPYIVMGQICIHKDYRGKGVFRNLYETMRQHYLPPFQSIITEVDQKNTRSLQAHLAIGFQTMTTYTMNEKTWELLCFR